LGQLNTLDWNLGVEIAVLQNYEMSGLNKTRTHGSRDSACNPTQKVSPGNTDTFYIFNFGLIQKSAYFCASKLLKNEICENEPPAARRSSSFF
jgi:hypothetical protein